MSENKFRNEMEIDLGEVKILLRPTLENIAAMENDLGGIAYLAYKYGHGVDLAAGVSEVIKQAKSLPSLSEAAKIIYHNQAEKKYSLDEVFGLCMDVGLRPLGQVVVFLSRMCAGNKFAKPISERQKKSSRAKSQVETE